MLFNPILERRTPKFYAPIDPDHCEYSNMYWNLIKDFSIYDQVNATSTINFYFAIGRKISEVKFHYQSTDSIISGNSNIPLPIIN